MGLNQNTWKLNQWYDQDVAGNVSYSGASQLWVMGYNTAGGLGQNNRTDYSSPVQVPGTWGSELGKASVGDDTIGSIKTDGTLWVMGINDQGQLGQNNTTERSSPVQIPGTWDQVEMGWDYSAAINTDGELWMWGYQGANPNGTLGQNEGSTKYSSPVQVPGTTWSRVTNGSAGSTFGLKTDGTLWSWGYNTKGYLGQNNRTSYSSPVQIPGTDWSNAFGGTNSSKSFIGIKNV